MAGRIRQEDIQAVRERTDIVKVIGGHLQLKKAGSDRLVGLCPFHAEKTPSLSVSPSKQLYYCFGCGEGGNVFRFLKQIESLSFGEVVERLAAEAGVTLRYEGQTGADRMAVGRRQSLHRAVGEAARLYHRTLTEGREGSEARSYLSSRGISRDSVDGFGIGYAPGYPDFLLRRLSKAFSPELLIEAGVVAKDSTGALRDRFRGRVVFPIHDLSGNAVGFGGRLLEGPKAPQNAAKYVNSPETPIYHKGTLLYNLNRAKPEITRSGRAFLVEGYTDVIALHQAGIPSAVATCGTALGEDHIRLLSRFAERAVLAFDSDEAGARAAERAYQFHERYPVELLVLVLPSGLDPADFVQSSGGEGFEGLAARAIPLVEYMIDRSLVGRDLTSLEERVRAVRAGLALVAGLEDPVRRQEYARLLAGRVSEPEISVMLELEQMQSALAPRSAQTDGAHRSRLPPHQKVEREALKLLIQTPSLSGSKLPGLRVEHFAMPQHRTAFALLTQAAPAPNGLETLAPSDLVAMAQEHARGDQIGKLIAALAVEPAETVGAVSQEYVDQVFLRLEEFCLKREADDIRKRLQRLNPLSASDEYDELYERFVKLEGARRRIRAAAEAVGAST
ncbi:MAG: DNA primase [Actinomycetota bacterium]